jgi:hypothetical protein
MRIILSCFILIAPLWSFSQSLKDMKISIYIQNQTLEQALIDIGVAAEVNFSYDSKLIQFDKKVTYMAGNESVQDILDAIINDPTIDYLYIKPQVILKKASPEQQEIRILERVVKDKKKEAKKRRAEKIKAAKLKAQQELANKNRVNDSLRLDSIEQPLLEPSTPDTVNSETSIDTSLAADSIKVKRWSVDLAYAPVFFNDTYKSDAGLENTVGLIDKSETPLLSHSINARIGYTFHQFNDRFKVETGISYAVYHKQANYSLTNFLTDTIESYDITDAGQYSDPFVKNSGYYILALKDTTWFTNYDSTWIPKADTTVVVDYQTTDTVINNNDKIRVDHVTIPLLISYRFGEIGKNKWTVAPKLGIIAAFTINTSGRTLNNEGNGFVQTNEIPFTKVLLIGYSGLNISYGLSDNIAIFGEGYYAQNLNNVYKSEYGLSRSVRSFGLSIGMRHNF